MSPWKQIVPAGGELPLSKTLDPADFDQLTEELAMVDQHFTSAAEQHPMRRWEYALALRALTQWEATKPTVSTHVVDVGGAGSPFYRMVGPYLPLVIDPSEAGGETLDQHLLTCPRLASVVFCLSVLEHVADLPRFLYHLGCLVAPGGLLFLTMDCADAPYQILDVYHFHWMRQRIFTIPGVANDVALPLLTRDFAYFGGRDLAYHGDHVYNYTFASLALQKRS